MEIVPKMQSNEVEPMVNGDVVSDCRLGQLNYDCLESIFELLCTQELIHLCNIDPIVSDAVKYRVVKKRMIYVEDWNQIWCTTRLFKEFGKFMRMLVISERCMFGLSNGESLFEQFLGLVVKHCSEDNLNVLSLHFDNGPINVNLLEATRPFLTNVYQIHIRSMSNVLNLGHTQFLETVIQAAHGMKTIQLENTTINGDWLQLNGMNHVENLCFINSEVIMDKQKWKFCFNMESALKSFTWINVSAANQALCELVAQKCSKMECFNDIQHVMPRSHLRKYAKKNRYSYLASAENLKCVQVTAYTRSGQDLVEFFGIAARKNTIQNLAIHFLENAYDRINIDLSRPNIHYRYPDFTSITALEIYRYPTCMVWGVTFENFVSELVNLREMYISSDEIFNSVRLTTIILAPPNLESCNVSQTNIVCPHSAIITIGHEIDIRKSMNDAFKGFTMILNKDQNAYLEGLDISENIRIEVN